MKATREQDGAATSEKTHKETHQNHRNKPKPKKAGARSTAPGVAAQSGRVTAFAGMERADRLAAQWSEDARLYAIASVVPEVDSSGRSPGWLYTYASPSAGAVLGIAVEGGKAKREQEQSLPDADLERITEHTLPPRSKLKDSAEAMKEAGKVRRYLEENPGVQASAGLDSFSSGEPSWILATVSRDERIEEKVPATSGS